MTRRWETTTRFFEFEVHGYLVTFRYGPLGGTGYRLLRTFPTEDHAAEEALQLAHAKEARGYRMVA
jgi:predicted DNA-binding WGR domain protein